MTPTKHSPSRPGARLRVIGAAATAGIGISLVACAPPSSDERTLSPIERPELAPDETAEGFDLDELIAAARQEGPITVFNETGRVVQISEAFTEKYGIEAHGVKAMSVLNRVEKEYEADNVIGDVVASQELPGVSELLRDGVLLNWIPGDMHDTLPESATYPFLNLNDRMIWSYNREVHGDTCPATNIWQLTDPELAGQVALEDPESRTVYTTAWNQAARNHATDYEEAYEEYYGEPLETDEPTAVHEWVKRLAQNSPVLFRGDEEVSDAVGAPRQSEPPIGFFAESKYRNNEEKGYDLAPCDGLIPFTGISIPQSMTIASKTEHPNAAKLYVHFATSQEGMEFVLPDGKTSFSSDVEPGPDEHGAQRLEAEGLVQEFEVDYLHDDYADTSTWQDYWRSSR